MALISAFTIIRAVSLFHITAAWFFLASPQILVDQNIVFILGESMRIPHATAFDKKSEATAFIGVVLAFLGISDLTAASMNEETALEYWLANVPVRLAFLFGLTAYSWLFNENGMFGMKALRKASIGEPLQNSLVFSFGFIEIAVWFWAFTGLREERRERARKQLEKLRAEEDRL